MQLSKPKGVGGTGGAAKKQALFADLGGLEELVAAGKKDGAEEEKHSVLTETVLLEVVENVNCSLSKDGDLQKFELKGSLFVTVTDAHKARAAVQLENVPVKGVKFKPHPAELSRQAWTEKKLLQSQNEEEGFPVNQKFEAVSYRLTSKDEVS